MRVAEQAQQDIRPPATGWLTTILPLASNDGFVVTNPELKEPSSQLAAILGAANVKAPRLENLLYGRYERCALRWL